MEANVTTNITKHTSLRILRSEQSPPDIIRGLVHETPDTTTFKCMVSRLDSVIQEEVIDSTQQIKALRFRQLSVPPPSLPHISTLISPSATVHMYSFVWKVEFSCPLDIRWVYHVLLPILPKLSFLRFGTGCFEEFYYDYNNEEVNQYYVQLLALKYARSEDPAACYPDVREIHISVDERKLSDFNYPFQALITSVNLILDLSIKYLKNSLSKTNLSIPSNCAIDMFLQAFPKIKAKGQKIENYEKNITKFVTTTSNSNSMSMPGDPRLAGHSASALTRTPSLDYSPSPTETFNKPNLPTSTMGRPPPEKARLDQSEGEKMTILSPPKGFYVDREDTVTKKEKGSSPVVYEVSDSSDDDVVDPRQAKLRIVDKSKIIAEDEDEQVCSSTTPTPLIIHPPKPAPMEKKLVRDIISSIAEESSSNNESDVSISMSSISSSSSSSSSGSRKRKRAKRKRRTRSRDRSSEEGDYINTRDRSPLQYNYGSRRDSYVESSTKEKGNRDRSERRSPSLLKTKTITGNQPRSREELEALFMRR